MSYSNTNVTLRETVSLGKLLVSATPMTKALIDLKAQDPLLVKSPQIALDWLSDNDLLQKIADDSKMPELPTLSDVVSSFSFLKWPGVKSAITQDTGAEIKYVAVKFNRPKFTAKEFLALCEQIGWEDIDPIPDGAGGRVVNALNFVDFAPGYEWGRMTRVFPELVPQLQEYCYTGGSYQGMVTVLQQAAADSDCVRDLSKYVEKVIEKLPFRDAKCNDGSKFTFAKEYADLVRQVHINTSSRAGPPAGVSEKLDVENIIIAQKVAMVLFRTIIDHGIDHFIEHVLPTLERHFCARIANKVATYLKSQVMEKTRSYYVYASALRVAGMAVYQPLNSDHVGFWHDHPLAKQSESMLGWSWFDGGGDKLVAKIRGTEERTITKLYYSDDHLWVIRVGGRLFATTPDIKHMDGSQRETHLDVSIAYDMARVKYHGGGEKDQDIVAFLKRMCMCHPVILQKSETVSKVYGNSSGNWDTTGMNQTSSAVVSVVVDVFFDSSKDSLTPDIEVLDEWLEAAASEVKDETGFVLKPATLKFVELKEDDKHWDIPFLGQTLHFDDGHWLPAPPMVNVLKSYVFHGPNTEEISAFELRMARAAGIALSGGYFYHDVLSFLAADYEEALVIQKSAIAAATAKSESRSIYLHEKYGDGTKYNIFAEKVPIPLEKDYNISSEVISGSHDWSKGFPSREWFVNLLTGKRMEKVVEPQVVLPRGEMKVKTNRFAKFMKKQTLVLDAKLPERGQVRVKEIEKRKEIVAETKKIMDTFQPVLKVEKKIGAQKALPVRQEKKAEKKSETKAEVKDESVSVKDKKKVDKVEKPVELRPTVGGRNVKSFTEHGYTTVFTANKLYKFQEPDNGIYDFITRHPGKTAKWYAAAPDFPGKHKDDRIRIGQWLHHKKASGIVTQDDKYRWFTKDVTLTDLLDIRTPDGLRGIILLELSKKTQNIDRIRKQVPVKIWQEAMMELHHKELIVNSYTSSSGYEVTADRGKLAEIAKYTRPKPPKKAEVKEEKAAQAQIVQPKPSEANAGTVVSIPPAQIENEPWVEKTTTEDGEEAFLY